MPFTSPAQKELDELNVQMEVVAKADNLIRIGHRAVEYGRHLKRLAKQKCRELEAGIALICGGTPVYT